MHKPKKYEIIVKIKNNADNSAHCVKYRVDNLLKFTEFLDTKWNDWKWFNVYSNHSENKGIQLGNFTKYQRPKSKYV